jgi:hypothetical protein
MNIKQIKIKYVLAAVGLALAISGCQKMSRPEFGEIVLDPPPPPYSTLKNFFAFDDNAGDSGQFRMKTDVVNVTYVDGIEGKAAKIGEGGYIVQKAINDSLKNPGSFTIAFWMNGVGPVSGGAQGLFALAKSTEFWGNIEIFLENDDADPDEAYLKVHMFNTNASDGIGEAWNEVKIPGALNKWTHIAVTYNSSTSELSIYADGAPTAVHNVVLDGGNYGDLVFADVNGMVIGTYAFQTDPSLTNHGPEDWARSFNGALDNFRFYNVALSDQEVNDLYVDRQ